MDVSDYYWLSQDLENVRALLNQVCQLIPGAQRHAQPLLDCVHTHEYDDALALLAVADGMREDETVSSEVYCLISRHQCLGKLQTILNAVRCAVTIDSPLRQRLESLIAGKAKRLACGELPQG